MRPPARTVALIPYPLSSGYRAQLEEAVGAEPTYLSLAELRRLAPRDAVARLRSLRGCRLLLALEGEDAAAVRPILEAVAAAARPARVEVVHPDLTRSPVGRWHAVPALLTLLRASVSGQAAVRASRRELERLVREQRIEAVRGPGRRILYLNGNLWVGLKAGGSIGHVAGVVNGLLAAGYAVDMATVVEPIGVRPEATVRTLSPGVFGLPVEANYYRFQREMARQLRGIARPGQAAFVYQRMSVANYSGVSASRRLGIPLVLEYNGSEVWVAANWGRPLRYERAAALAEEASIGHAHLVVTVSDVLRDELLARGVEAERIVTHPNGVDVDVFDPGRFDGEARAALRARYGIDPDAVVVGFLGTFGQWHGAEVLARAIARLGADDGAWLERRRVRFLFVGDGLRLPEVRQITEDARASGLVRFAGLVPQHEAPAHLAATDILVSPHTPNADGSRFFGSPTKLFEYMAMGKAIVASNLDQVGEALQPALDAAALPRTEPGGDERQVAILTEPGSEEALIAALRFAVEQPDWRALLGANARRLAAGRYTWNDHVAAIVGGLERLS